MEVMGNELKSQYEFKFMCITTYLPRSFQCGRRKRKEGFVVFFNLLLVCEEIEVMSQGLFECSRIQSVLVMLPCPPEFAVYFDSLTFLVSFFSSSL